MLAVDDDKRVREMLSEMFSNFGYECRIAANSREALNILKEDHFSIVISDIRMPGMDGIALLKQIKENYPDIDVISITGYSKDYTFIDVVKAGATDFIIKPFSKDELEAKLRRIIRERELKSDIIASRNELMAIFNGIRESMYTIDYDFEILSANKAFAESAGLPVEDVIGRKCYKIINKGNVPCEGDDHSCPAKRSFARGLPAVTIHKYFEKNGTELYREITAMPLTGDNEKTTQAILLSRDITSRFLTEKKIKESEEKYKMLVEMAHEGIISTNKDGIITIFNEVAEEIFDCSREKVIGRSISMLIPERYFSTLEAEYEKIAASEESKSRELPMKVMGLRVDGSEIPLELSLSDQKDKKGELTIALFVRRDTRTGKH